MSGEYGYIVRLLRKLEFTLAEYGYQREAGRMGQIIQRIARADDVRAALRTLSSVEGYNRLALRLLFYADRTGPLETELPDDHLIDYQVSKLYGAIVDDQDADIRPSTRRLPPSTDVTDAVEQFVKTLGELRRGATEGEIFHRIQLEHLEKLLQKAHDLGSTADREGSPDISRFAASSSTFVRYVLDRSLFDDVRVVNILDNAVLTLQTVLPSVGADDYDSLAQTNQLLADPTTLLN
jgi:hypothetical protein